MRTMEWMKKQKLHAVLINNPRYNQIDCLHLTPSTNKFRCSLSQNLNEEQKAAVRHIVWGEKIEIPTILHGPPGTGKTRTLVAAIAEIVHDTKENILVLAHSNSACDVITKRLIEVLPPSLIFRLYAKSFKEEAVDPKIMPICNFRGGEFQLPSLKYLYQFRVLVTTLLTAGSLMRSRGEDEDFDSSHFPFVFF